MASTARSRPPATTSRLSSHPASRPPYQPLTHSLDPGAQHALRSLPTTHPLNDLKRRLQTAVLHLTEVTGDLNDQYQARRTDYERLKARRAARARELQSSQGTDDVDEEGDRRMEDAWRQTDGWTAKMEERTRRVIDIQARMVDGENALEELSANVAQGRTATQSSLGASQHPSRSQRHQQSRRGRQVAEGDELDDDAQPEFDDQGSQQEQPFTGPTPLETFQTKLLTAESTYASLSLKDRYASHNDYIGFRKIVHDARHPNDDTPLPHPSTWFPAPDSTARSQANRNTHSASADTPQDSDSDADIQVAREKRSIRCPLTLLPLTSTLCPHSFERSAILSMLDASTVRANAAPSAPRNGEKAIKCPECEVQLTASTLRPDPVLVRKIRRIEEQERREREQDGSEDEDDEDEGIRGPGRRKVEEVTSSPAQSRTPRDVAAAVKRERMSATQTTQASREPSMVPATQIVDLEDGDEDEGEEED